MAEIESKVLSNTSTGILKETSKNKIKELMYKLIMMVILIIVWYLLAEHYGNELILPTPKRTGKAFIKCLTSSEIITNLLITLNRVLKGFMYAMIIGVPLGLFMGAFKMANNLIGGFIDSIRQVPIMAWVPLTIVWFGIGDGPTIFLITFSGIFPVILNTIAGVKNISKDYYNAARSMGAGPWSIFSNIILPASIPDILTGARIAISGGWMSVI
ncbi:binding--dependent transport system inner membrane component family protein [Clostridium sporogenes]|nr:binding--dependent transport system inner membrane component family protein [Clostridium sporogenes]